MSTTIDISALEDAKGFLAAYRYARDRIGAVPLVETEPLEDIEEGALVTPALGTTDE